MDLSDCVNNSGPIESGLAETTSHYTKLAFSSFTEGVKSQFKIVTGLKDTANWNLRRPEDNSRNLNNTEVTIYGSTYALGVVGTQVLGYSLLGAGMVLVVAGAATINGAYEYGLSRGLNQFSSEN